MVKKRDYVDKGELIRLEKMLEQEREARRIAEKALQVAQKDLEKRVLERTLELEKANKTLQAEIAERRRVEEALKESEEKNRTLVEHSFDYICETSADGRFLYVNPKHKDLLDYQPDELQGKSIFEFIHPDDRSRVISEFQRAIATFSSGHAIFRFRHKNGQWNWLESTGRPFRTAAGEIRGIIASRDITERRKSEERQTQLLKELESVNQELNDFAYIVSHDLKAPLRAISSLANWIATDYAEKLEEDGKNQLSLLVTRVKRMHSLIDGILQYSRTGRVKERKVLVNLNQLLAEVIYLIAPPAHIDIQVEDELPSILCERTRIEQVFQNLLSNAVKFMDKQRGEIKITCAQEDGYWKFSIADNGPGIDEKYFDKIFQIFQTLAPRDESENTGVGLALVKKIIEMYNGKIWVESKVGHGSKFFFTLPV
jgi:PAS domain S-box-containing protein